MSREHREIADERSREAESLEAFAFPRPNRTLDAFTVPRPNRTLAALTTSALALPGIAPSASADAPIERATAASSTSYYFEDNLSPGKFEPTVGSRERYEVIAQQLRFDLPVSERMDLGIDLLYEEMSGASPWFVVVQPVTQKLLQVMSGATIDDTRVDAAVDLDFYMDSGKDTFNAGISVEKDYTSLNFGLGAERNFNDKNTVFNVSGGFSYDWVDATDADGDPTRPGADQKWSIDLFAGLSQILSRASTVQATINYKHSDGFLNDPYKLISQIGGGNLSDERPDSKDQVSLLFRYRHHFEALVGSAHLDYRFYADDWNIRSHTIEAAWYQQVYFEWLTFSTTFRWYTQGKADFYEPTLNPGITPSERSSDFRLSPYGALSVRGKLEVDLRDVARYSAPLWLERLGVSEGLDLLLSLTYERYLSDGAWAATSVPDTEEAPGLVSFQVVSFGISGRF